MSEEQGDFSYATLEYHDGHTYCHICGRTWDARVLHSVDACASLNLASAITELIEVLRARSVSA